MLRSGSTRGSTQPSRSCSRALDVQLSGEWLVLVQCKDQLRMLFCDMYDHVVRATLQEGLATGGAVTTDQAHPFCTAAVKLQYMERSDKDRFSAVHNESCVT